MVHTLFKSNNDYDLSRVEEEEEHQNRCHGSDAGLPHGRHVPSKDSTYVIEQNFLVGCHFPMTPCHIISKVVNGTP